MATAALPLAVVVTGSQNCMPSRIGIAQTALAPAPVATSKSSAILGGQLSALEKLKLQQAGLSPAAAPANVQPAGTDVAAANSSSIVTAHRVANCAGAREPLIAPSISLPSTNPEDFLASGRLEIGRTMFDKQWSRVSAQSLSSTQLRRSLGSAPQRGDALISQVNGWVNRNISYVEDIALYNRRDYWAGARQTLGKGKGDCEDIAILKMQMLAAAGIRRDDMILTIARDTVRNTDHAVLIVKQNGRFVMLDNATDRVLEANQSYDYRPILSFGATQNWLHGYSNRSERPVYLSVNATSSARLTGLSK
ncbi:transglutaminase-like cysteine peptidase [Altererythrobacter aquiaggeris]|uniref:transglutaminase-like cysteine peptidase n=1 Tax=Aestuarierythrobacter aquiaggeris TaxID=1898396 RepID=UPI003016188C